VCQIESERTENAVLVQAGVPMLISDKADFKPKLEGIKKVITY
jgi:hypothetical protein